MGYMIPMFVCIDCARTLLKKDTEKHYSVCVSQEEILYRYRMHYNGTMDRTKNDLIVPRGISNFGPTRKN